MMEHRLTRLDQHTPKEMTWLWKAWIPCGAISLIEGDPGGNKSTLVYDIAARVTTGRPMFASNEAPPPQTVILFQAEDMLDTMSRNLDAAGADLAKVYAYDRSSSAEGQLALPEDMEFLRNEVDNTQAKLLVVDPITAFVSTNINNDQSIRRALQPLVQLAEQTGTAVVLVRHLTKSVGANPLYRGADSIGLIGAARAAFLIAPDPGDTDRRILAQTKSSLARKAASIAFRPVSKGDGVAIEWIGDSDYSAAQLLEAARSQSRSELEEAIYVLYSILAEGPLPAKEAKDLSTAAGISPRTLRRAKEILEVRSQRRGFGKGSKFFWHLPDRHEIVARLHEQDMGELMDSLCFGESSGEVNGQATSHSSDQAPKEERRGDNDDDPPSCSA